MSAQKISPAEAIIEEILTWSATKQALLISDGGKIMRSYAFIVEQDPQEQIIDSDGKKIQLHALDFLLERLKLPQKRVLFRRHINEGLLINAFKEDAVDQKLVDSVLKIAEKSDKLTHALFDSFVKDDCTLDTLHKRSGPAVLNKIATRILDDNGDDIELFLEYKFCDKIPMVEFMALRPSLAWSVVQDSIEAQRDILKGAGFFEFNKESLEAVFSSAYD